MFVFGDSYNFQRHKLALFDNKIKPLMERYDYYSDFFFNAINRLCKEKKIFNGASFEPFREQSSLASEQYQKFSAQTSPKDLKDLIVQLLV